mmetsp:Transcript_2177/g.6633  ORF Transcript_2177/g.6633 Transcript_2177/m.6633 type:complete len:293 (-) Transcript_2177:1276-2154(-)
MSWPWPPGPPHAPAAPCGKPGIPWPGHPSRTGCPGQYWSSGWPAHCGGSSACAGPKGPVPCSMDMAIIDCCRPGSCGLGGTAPMPAPWNPGPHMKGHGGMGACPACCGVGICALRSPKSCCMPCGDAGIPKVWASAFGGDPQGLPTTQELPPSMAADGGTGPHGCGKAEGEDMGDGACSVPGMGGTWKPRIASSGRYGPAACMGDGCNEADGVEGAEGSSKPGSIGTSDAQWSEAALSLRSRWRVGPDEAVGEPSGDWPAWSAARPPGLRRPRRPKPLLRSPPLGRSMPCCW